MGKVESDFETTVEINSSGFFLDENDTEEAAGG
jgi:hypothetical protein